MEHLIPSWADLAGWAGVLVIALLLTGFGRLLSLGRAAPEMALIAGWGGACLLLTLWGVATTASLRVPAAAVMAVGFAALFVDRLRLHAAEWRSMLRMGAVALPLIIVMASAQPSLPDTFLNLLPNAAYLYDHATFPADDRWPSYSFLPGAPYNLQLAGFLVSLVTPDFPPSAMIGLNILLQLAFALFLARLIERHEDDVAHLPSWRATALGLLLATALNPGFVPRYHVSGYSEASVTVTIAAAAWFAARAIERLAARRPAGADLALFALALAALVNIKQDSIAMALGLVASCLGLAVVETREARAKSVVAILSAAAPAAVLYLAWRWYVLRHFAVGELKPLPVSAWQFHNIPRILWSAAGVIWQKPYFFGALAIAFIALVRRFRSRGLDQVTRLGALFIGVTVLYNAALFLTYIAHFPGEMGAEAHSYFRYNTHLGLLLVLVLVLLTRDALADWARGVAGTTRRVMTALPIGVALLCPLIFLGFLRFDLEEPQQRARQLAAAVSPTLSTGERLALLLPGDNGSLATMLEGLIRLVPPRHPNAELRFLSALGPDTLDQLAADGYRFALVSCAPSDFAGVTAGHAALLRHDASGWHAAPAWSYPAPRWRHWSHVVAEAPLCL